nr:hypothetical protein [Tanacetum cinerariifolium]
MSNKKRIVNLEYFKEMLLIYLRIHNQTFDELPFKEEILAFLRYLRHSGKIKKITDVNINHEDHLLQLSTIASVGKVQGTIVSDFVYQVEYKDAKKSNEMYYPRFTKVLINFFMTKDPSITRTNKFGAMFPVKLTNEDIKNSTVYKEYYAIASGAAPPKTKESVRKTQSSYDTTMPHPTAAGTRLSTSAKGKQPAKSSKVKDERTGIIPGVLDVPTNESDEEISWKSSDEDDDDDVDDQKAKEEESFDPIVQTPSQVENSDDESNDDESHGMNVRRDEGPDAEDDDEELYTDVNINLEGHDVQMTDVHTTQVLQDTHMTLTLVNPDGIDSLFESTPRVDVLVTTTVVPFLATAPTLPPSSIPIMSQVQQTPAPTPTTALSTSLQDLPNFGSLFGFDHRLKTLEANFSEFMETNQFVEAVTSIPGIVDRYIDYGMNETVKVAVRLQSDRLRDEAQAENEEIINKLDENIQKIIKDPSVDLPVVLDAFSFRALVDSGPFPFLLLLDPRSDRGSKRRRKGKGPESTSALKEKASKTTATRKSIQPWISDLAKQADSRTSFNELMDTPMDFSAFLMNRLKVDTLTSELLVGPTCELMKGSCKSLVELEFFQEEVYKAATDQLDWNNPEGQQYPHNLLKPLQLIPNSRGRRVIPFDHFINNDLEYLCGGVKSYQKKLNITKSDTYKTDLKPKKAYTAYSNPRGFIFQNKDKLNRLMRIDELRKFSDDTLNDVRTALDDRLKGIRMKYLPHTLWRRSDKERAAVLIQAIDNS